MSKAQLDFEKLHSISRHAKVLSGISSLLDWDHETYMPSEGAGIRSEQSKILAGIIHKEKTSRKFKKALENLIEIKTGKIRVKELSERQNAAVKVWRNDYIKETTLPGKFVEEFAKLTSQGLQVWRYAKEENSFQHFAPFLDKIISMNRKKADLIGYEEHPYDALLDHFEPEATTKEISTLFDFLRKSIIELQKKIVKAPQIDDGFLFGKFAQEKQLEFGKVILTSMGFNSSSGRLDISTHPFSSSCHPTDNRITTRIHPTSLMSNISVLLHEGGHALYEMGVPQEFYGSPLGEPLSLGMHESQSRWWETLIGQSKSFWFYYLPLLKKQFKGKISEVSLENFYKAINKVESSLIRVEADEVTYTLHVILRFELEKALIEGSLSVRDIPEAWNAKMKELLGIVPQTNSEGCLQDMHWSMGAFGYFPTYTLGNLYASHLFKSFAKIHPNWEKKIELGELQFIKEWLNKNIHLQGRRFSSKELLQQVTGEPFTAKAYINYLNKKYSEIYSLE
jgi:carboxypeptidase Taq